MPDSYREIIITGLLAEDAAYELVLHGALGASAIDSGISAVQAMRVILSLDDPATYIDEVLREYSCKKIHEEVKKEENYVSRCESVWYPIYYTPLTFRFIENNDSRKRIENTIYLNPGSGFGTGHHPTTRMIIEEMVRLKATAPSLRTVFDVGAGSAILSLVASELFSAEITAWESDQAAVQNAEFNFSLNPALRDSIELIHQPFATEQLERCELLVANLYAELLIELEPQFRSSLMKGGKCLLSGILSDQIDGVLDVYRRRGWSVQTLAQFENWCMVHMELV